MLTAVDDSARTAQRCEVIPVRRGGRQIGAYVVEPAGTRFVPAVDVTTIVVAALAAATAASTAVSIGLALRRRPVVGSVTMGPGGWLSLKHGTPPPLRATAATDRPWWAHLLRAHRLVVRR
jgi:hypothetical protein